MTESETQQNQLRNWYLARLRKRALSDAAEASAWTPAALIVADRAKLEALIAEKAKSVNANKTGNFNKFNYRTLLYLPIGALLLSVAAIIYMVLAGPGNNAFPLVCLIGVAALLALQLASGRNLRDRELGLRQLMTNQLSRLNKANEISAPATDSLEESLERTLEHLVRLEERQNLIADYGSEVICVLNDNLQFVAISPSCNQIFGRSPLDLLQHTLLEVTLEEDRNDLQKGFLSAKSKPGETAGAGRIQSRSGTLIDTEWSIEWSNSQNKFFAAVRDVTAKKEIERMKNEFIAIVSHDLRSPITSVQWTLELFLEGIYGELNEMGVKRAKEAIQSVDFMLDLIADTLDLHRMDTSVPDLCYSPVTYKSLVAESVSALEAMASAKEMTIEQVVPEGEFEVDKVRVKRVLINLLSNAIKFAPKNTSITVEVTKKGDQSVIAIKDRGKGIRPEFIEKLFDRFCNVGEPSARRDGSGLGLFASKAIVEAHNGRIYVESEEGKGTTFFVCLPDSAPRTVPVEQ